jgi:hypothetical protein
LGRLCEIGEYKKRRRKRSAERVDRLNVARVLRPSISARRAVCVLYANRKNVILEFAFKPIDHPLEKTIRIKAVVIWKCHERSPCEGQSMIPGTRQAALASSMKNGEGIAKLAEKSRDAIPIPMLVDNYDLADKSDLWNQRA